MVLVAVPARDEAAAVATCIRSIQVAASSSRVHVPVMLVVAADSCTDDTAAVARRLLDDGPSSPLTVIEGDWASASRARAAAIGAGLAQLGSLDRSGLWLANTDADCVVPPDWLARQLALAASGADAVAGTVRLDPATTCPQLLARFGERYGIDGPTHRHVHAANLGVRADVYLRLGGWCSRTVLGEEHALWRCLTSGGYDVRQPADVVVTTSSRTVGRVRGGFASALSRLVDGTGRRPAAFSDHAEGVGRSRLGSLETTTS